MLMSTDLNSRRASDRVRLAPMIEQPPRAGADHAVGHRAMGKLELLNRRADRLIEPHLVDGRAAGGIRRHLEPLPEQCHLLMLDAELEQRDRPEW